jgi:hypothetical protein
MFSESEDVRGTCIGGDNYIKWQLFYEGSPKSGSKQIAESETDAEKAGRLKLQEIKDSWNGNFYLMYPNRNPDAWEIRIWGHDYDRK